jgi:DNA helicase-2/ATP-dependent DNA helicase PcrA
VRLLLAGPGTGKTSRVKGIVEDEFAAARRILVLSFTNATVRDLTASFADCSEVDCYTLHSYALRINHLRDHHVLDSSHEAVCLMDLADGLHVDFRFLCRQLQCITFDAMISECLEFLRNNPAYGREQIGKLDLLVVDEYQDFNPAERDLIKAISAYADETIVLGDDDQSIYGFKDADPDGIIQLYERPDVVKLAHDNLCHRCPDAVVDCAMKLIAHNKNRIEKPWGKTQKLGDCIRCQFLTQAETKEYLVSEIERARGADPSTTFLVLSPVRFYMDDFVALLGERGIKYVDFWAPAVDMEDYARIWWLRAIFSQRKLLNLIFLSRQLAPHHRKKLKGILSDALQRDFDHEGVLQSITHMYNTDLVAYVENPPTLAQFAEEQPAFTDLVQRLDEADLENTLQRLLKDMNPAKEFEGDSVNVMSIHKSKGLEADVVFITGLVDGILPNKARGIDTLEAQRRLLYVGVTRARRSLHLLSSVEWDGAYVNKVDKSQFQYSWRKKKYSARTSMFLGEVTQSSF